MNYTMKDLLPLVKMLSERYTSKDSTSVPYETAKQLMGAVLYCIREIALANGGKDRADGSGAANCPAGFKFGADGDAPACNPVPAPQPGPAGAKAAYEIGYELVCEKTRRAKKLYEALLPDFNDYGNEALRAIILDGIPEFFVRYDPRFCPQARLLTLDYPLLRPAAHSGGVDEIWDCLSCIRLEQKFLGAFPENRVREILMAFHPDYGELFFNLCSPVLANLLGHLLLQKPFEVSGFSDEEYGKLSLLVTALSQDALGDRLEKLLARFTARAFDGDEALLHYLSFDLSSLTARLKAAGADEIEHVLA